MEKKDQLSQLGDLYEEAKLELQSLSILGQERDSYFRVFDILKEIRNIAATAITEKKEEDGTDKI